MSYVPDLHASWTLAAIATGVAVIGVVLAAWLELWLGRRIAAWRSAVRLSRTRSALTHPPARAQPARRAADGSPSDSALMGLINATGR